MFECLTDRVILRKGLE